MASPYAGLDSSLRALSGAAQGFGRASIGGRDGEVYTVSTLAESGPGSLREACKHREPLWIVFGVSGTIQLSDAIKVNSYKTIDGRGQNITLRGNGLHLKQCAHVIVCNIQFSMGRGPDVDGIKVKPNCMHIWIDRCSLEDYDDGLIDITRGSTDVTISRCRFRKHSKTILIGADPKHIEDREVRVTIHHCFFDGTIQRHPRVRFAKVHLYNNYTRNWGIYGVCASVESQVLSQCNIYESGDPKKLKAFEYYTEQAADRSDACTGSIRSEGDAFLNGALGAVQSPEVVFDVRQFYAQCTIEPASAKLKESLEVITGWQDIPLPPDQGVVAS